jgi:hypothetical protein
LRGRWRHRDIRSEPAERGELALGILTHYATGIILTQAFLQLPRRGNGRPSFLGATGFGMATAILPLLVLYPSMGYGLFGLRSGEAARINRIMLLGHAAFGIGIGLWAPYFAGRRPGPCHKAQRHRRRDRPPSRHRNPLRRLSPDSAEFEAIFAGWKRYYTETEVRPLITPAEAMIQLDR